MIKNRIKIHECKNLGCGFGSEGPVGSLQHVQRSSGQHPLY